jgi:hypothetical protein
LGELQSPPIGFFEPTQTVDQAALLSVSSQIDSSACIAMELSPWNSTREPYTIEEGGIERPNVCLDILQELAVELRNCAQE